MEMDEQIVKRWVDGGRDNALWPRNPVSMSSWPPSKTTIPSFLCNSVEPPDRVLANGLCVGREERGDRGAPKVGLSRHWVT